MLKTLTYLCSLLLLSSSLVFGSMPSEGPGGPPHRPDKLDMHSTSAQIKLSRAEHILSTLVPDPQSYQLILSSHPSMGGEAWPPHVYSDKPTIILYQGSLAPSRSQEEIAFMMAHELGHLKLYHNESMGKEMEQIMTGPPIGISGTTFTVFHQKLQEQEADLYGLSLYKQAGYDLTFFPHTLGLIKINPNIHFGTTHVFARPVSSLSMTNSHFSMQERFELLAQLAAQ